MASLVCGAWPGAGASLTPHKDDSRPCLDAVGEPVTTKDSVSKASRPQSDENIGKGGRKRYCYAPGFKAPQARTSAKRRAPPLLFGFVLPWGLGAADNHPTDLFQKGLSLFRK